MYTLSVITFLLLLKSIQCQSVKTANLLEHTAESFKENLLTGKTSFIYFGKQVNPAIMNFMEQLEISANALKDYGIIVAKVNCSKESIPMYCSGEELMKKAFLFRGADVLRSFDIDTVFDVSAIVSHVLFTVLFNEVRYVHTPAELLNVENEAKGKTDIVMGHIQALGLPEHRALMEAAFVYGAKYQFVQSTGSPILKHMGLADEFNGGGRLWFLHCSRASHQPQHCTHTLMRKTLTTLNIHTFLQLMEAPLLMELDVDPVEVDVIYNRLGVPVLFLFTQPETLHLDRDTAEHLAWRLRGEAGVVLIHRNAVVVKTPLSYNAAFRLPQEDVKYFHLKNVEEAVSLFRQELVQNEKEEEEEEEEEEEDDEGEASPWSELDVLDDEVAEGVYRDRGVKINLDSVLELTADTFDTAVSQSGLTVVLFYVKWDTVSMAFMQSYVEVADALEDKSGVELSSVDCGEWTDVCREQNITSFPTVLLFPHREPALPYRGMLGTQSLHRFLLMFLSSSLLSLSSSDEVISFLEGDLYVTRSSLSTLRVLGLFTSRDKYVEAFEEAAKYLRGETILGLFVHQEAEKWAQEHTVTLPALLVSRGPGEQPEVHPLLSSEPQDLISHIRRATLDTFPELTVENLPWFLELGKPLLLLFVGGEESPETTHSLDEMRRAKGSGHLESYLPCWIHLGRTPAGRSVLESYMGFVPPLPALVLSQLSSEGEVFHFPSERPLLVKNIIQWLQNIENKREPSAGVIADEARSSALPFYDFLAIMDEEAPGYAAQRSTKTKAGGERGQRGAERGPEQGAGGENRPAERESPKPHPKHTEL